MELSTKEQVVDALRSRESILIVLPKNPSPDAIASGAALSTILRAMQKEIRIVSSDFQFPSSLGFLPARPDIHTDLDADRKLVISLALKETKLGELSYDVQDDMLKIFITPKGKGFHEKDVKASLGEYNFSLIITLDTPSLQSLGPLFEQNADLFYQVPIVNIDHHPTNDSFGQINYVDLVATSTSEIVLDLIQELKPDVLDDAMATNLLTGIITKTRCFRSPSVTPKALSVASHLIEMGAKREDIVRHLYQTHSLTALKLWGRALARLKEAHHGQFVWTILNRQDFQKSGADARALHGVIDELIVNMPRARVILVVYEGEDGQIHGLAQSDKQIRNLALFKDFQPSGTDEYAELRFPDESLEIVEAKVAERVEAYFRTQGLLS
ncbi:MAG: hypothetical protein H6760_04835 [Candidatus Nomurabacteria bacterium]|nr:MAG: hypothetical protein H6760_04835 [Candidatus Nomurabacteria bacterium]